VGCSCKLSRTNRVTELPSGLEPRFLEGLTPAALSVVLGAARHKAFRVGAVLAHEDEKAERLFLLISGRARSYCITRDGKKVLINWLVAGQVIGGAALVSASLPYIINTEMIEVGCALIWNRPSARQLAARYPRLLENAFVIAYEDHIAWLIEREVSLVRDDARGRLADLLLGLARSIGRPLAAGGIELVITHRDLAAGANVTHFTAGRVIAAWQKTGVLENPRGKIVLRDLKRLRARLF
jgi:CRP-like cAMP-binding protein